MHEQVVRGGSDSGLRGALLLPVRRPELPGVRLREGAVGGGEEVFGSRENE